MEFHRAGDFGEDRVIAADADMPAGMELGAALADDDVARDHGLAAELLDAEAAARRIAPVARGAACFLMRHRKCSLGRLGDRVDAQHGDRPAVAVLAAIIWP